MLRHYFASELSAGRLVAWVAAADGEVVASSELVYLQKAPSPANLSGREA